MQVRESAYRNLDKENVIFTHNGVSVINKSEITSFTRMGETGDHQVK
jgi:hypothetical protein